MTVLTHDDVERSVSEDSAVMLVFLRHKGCLFTRQLMESTRRADEGWLGRTILVHQNSLDEYDATLSGFWPEAEHVADPDARLYERFGVARGGMNEMFGLRSWMAGIKAFFRGHRIGWRGAADGWTLPTIVWFEQGKIVREHRGSHAGDHPDFDLLPT